MISEEKKIELKSFVTEWLLEKQKSGEVSHILTKPAINMQYFLTPSLYKLNMNLMPVSGVLTRRNVFIKYQILLKADDKRNKYIAEYKFSCLQTEGMSEPLKEYFKDTLLPRMNKEWRPLVKKDQYYDKRLVWINDINENMSLEELRAFLEDGYREGLIFEKKLGL